MKHHENSSAVIPYLERLKLEKVKLTVNRRRVLDQFMESDSPWTLRSLHTSLNQVEECNLSSVYRALEALRAAGVLEEFRLPGDRQTFFSLIKKPTPSKAISHAAHGHHHHIVCQDCGKVSHLDMCVPLAYMGKVENASGYRITAHQMEFTGLCAKCR